MELAKKQNIFIVVGLIAAAALTRLFPHPPNVTPLSAIALLGGAYIAKKYLAFIIPFAILFASDLILNNTLLRGFYPEVEGLVIWQPYMNFVYLGFLVIVALGFLLKKNRSFGSLIGVTLLATILFFLITNFGIWTQGIYYPKSFGGLMACYSAGLPFLRNSLLGNLFFVVVLFSVYNYFVNKLPTKEYKLA